jgi:hypothetical protein
MEKKNDLSKNHEEKIVDFDVIKENWSAYELKDGTIIRTKNVLMGIIEENPPIEEAVKPKLRKSRFEAKLLNFVRSPKSIRKSKGESLEVSELDKYIIEPNVFFRSIKDGGDAVYRAEGLGVTVKTRVYQIDKTSKFDQNGNPSYIIRTENEIMVALDSKKKGDLKIQTDPQLSN